MPYVCTWTSDIRTYCKYTFYSNTCLAFRIHGFHPGSPGSTPGVGKEILWASLVAQMVKNLPAMQENWVRSLGWEDPLQKGKATHSSSILAWRMPWLYSPWGRKELDTTEQLSLHSETCSQKIFLEIHKENFKEQVKSLDLSNFQTYTYISTDPYPGHNVNG